MQVITIVFIDDISYLHEKPFIWIEAEKIHFGFSHVILTEIQISQSTALICCISDVTHPYYVVSIFYEHSNYFTAFGSSV